MRNVQDVRLIEKEKLYVNLNEFKCDWSLPVKEHGIHEWATKCSEGFFKLMKSEMFL